jgi:hypothetical protein
MKVGLLSEDTKAVNPVNYRTVLSKLLLVLIFLQLIVLPPVLYAVTSFAWVPALSFVAPAVATIYIWVYTHRTK